MMVAPILRTRLSGLRVAVDVQHLFRPSKPKDQGAVFALGDGTHRTEGAISLHYAQHLVEWLRSRGADVFTNEPHSAEPVMVGEWSGPYSRRQWQANAIGVHAYLACHVNAGGGGYGAVEAMNGTRGIELAQAIVRRLIADFPELRTSRVVRLNRQDRGAVCIRACETSVAAVLLEPVFGDYRPHQAIIESDKRMDDLSGAIGAGVAAWWERR